MITLYTRQQKRYRCIGQSFWLCARGRGWDDLEEWHWNMYNIIYETNHQSRFDAWYRMLGSSQCTSPKHPTPCIKPILVICFLYDVIHVSMPFFQIIPPLPSPTDSKRLFYTSVSLLLSCIQGYPYHLSKFHIYALVYYIGVFLSGLLPSDNRLQFHPPH